MPLDSGFMPDDLRKNLSFLTRFRLFYLFEGLCKEPHVQDDLRTAGAGIDVSGTVGDDLLVAGGGNPNFSFPIQTQGHTIMQGVRLTDSATVGGDATILGGVGQIASAIDGNLIAAMADVSLNGHVSGNAQVNAGALALGDAAQIDGDLNYQTEQRIDTAGVVGGTVGYQPPTPTSAPDPIAVWIDRLTRAALALLGFAALGWLLLRLAPRSLSDPAEAISARPGGAVLWGLACTALLIFVPLLSALLVFAMVLFWGWLPGIALLLLLFTGLSVLWVLSPLITGLWLGRQVGRAGGRDIGNVAALILGAAVIVLISLVPYLGWLTYLASFLFAVGGLAMTWRRRSELRAAPLV